VATKRYIIVDADTAAVAWYAESIQAYTDEDYATLMGTCGFAIRGVYPSLDGSAGSGEFVVVVGTAVA